MSYANWKAGKKRQAHFLWKDIKDHRTCYAFLAPYAIIFTLFYIAPVIVSIYYSFTYFNVLQPPRFILFQNYINLILADDIFLTAVKNTFLIAAITGPVGYIMAFIFAWLIHELPRGIRAIAVLVFYAPTISGQVYLIWSFIFSGDAYGYANAYLVEWGIMDNPVLWLTNPQYMMGIVIVVQLWLSLGAGFLSFIAGLNTIPADQYEAGYVDGIRNRWQELWYITLPNMKSMLMFGAVMAITQSFNTADVTMNLCGFPSTDYAARTIVTHLIDYGSYRFEMGYASAIATVLFLAMYLCNKFIQKALSRLGT
ncbi:MAG: sugar ABC transporter permease [Lachnospiraceae bacterium]|nr:sugar ABC transporter permease [Lachnospiraceae bacterium]